jgi:hypothetical protein
MAQWRLLLAWWLVLTVPAVLVGLPVWQALSRQLDHSLLAPALAQGWPCRCWRRRWPGLPRPGGRVPVLGAFGLVWTLLFTLADGHGRAAARQPTPLRWNELLRAGLADWPHGAAAGLEPVLLGLALALGRADPWGRAAGRAAGAGVRRPVLGAPGQGPDGAAGVAGPGQHRSWPGPAGAEPRRRSAVLAWWHALPQLWRGRGLGSSWPCRWGRRWRWPG